MISILRVISGSARGQKLKTVPGLSTRPISDRVKESLFNIINWHLRDANTLDLFAGNGSIGIEALSRGAGHCTFVDIDKKCIDVIDQNLDSTRLKNRATVVQGDVINVISQISQNTDIIFLDPPYGKNLIPYVLNNLSNNDIINDKSIIIAKHQINDQVPEELGKLVLARRKEYGITVISFYCFDRHFFTKEG